MLTLITSRPTPHILSLPPASAVLGGRTPLPPRPAPGQRRRMLAPTRSQSLAFSAACITTDPQATRPLPSPMLPPAWLDRAITCLPLRCIASGSPPHLLPPRHCSAEEQQVGVPLPGAASQVARPGPRPSKPQTHYPPCTVPALPSLACLFPRLLSPCRTLRPVLLDHCTAPCPLLLHPIPL